MEMSNILFVAFSLMTVLPVFYMLFTRNIIRAAFALVISFLGLAALYVLLHSELMAVVQILIYAGGIIVLLLFGIMLTKRGKEEGVYTAHRNLLIAGVTSTALFLLLAKLIWETKWFLGDEPNVGNQVKFIGTMFLTKHLIAFELIAFVLLVALVGAAYLAKKSTSS